MKTKKYALIGCGRIGKYHLLAAMENQLEIVAICDILPERMEEVLQAAGCTQHPARYTDYKKMLIEHPEIELAAIATPSNLHAPMALTCIDRQTPVIIEKPMALSLADADEIIAQSEKKHVTVAVNFQNRFNDAIQKTRKALRENRFGVLSQVSVAVRWHRDADYYRQADWRGKWLSDGGCLMNQCIHGIDLLRWMGGNEISEVYAMTARLQHDYIECEDFGGALIKFKNGVIGTLEASVNMYQDDLEETLLLTGTRGTVRVGGTAVNRIDYWRMEDSEAAADGETVKNVYGTGHSKLYADMLDALANGRKPYVGPEEGRRAVELVLAIYKSAKTNKPVRLPLKKASTKDFVGMF